MTSIQPDHQGNSEIKKNENHDHNEDYNHIEDHNHIDSGYVNTAVYSRKNTILGLLTLRDLLFAVILGVAGGFISSLVPFSDLVKAFYPITGGTQLVSGHHVLWMTIAFGITRKKVSPIVTAFVKGIIEAMLGDDLGAFIIVMNLLEGASVAICFGIADKLKELDTTMGWAISGGVANFVQAPVFWMINQRYLVIPWPIAVTSWIFAFFSGVLISGLLGREISKLILKGLQIKHAEDSKHTEEKKPK